VSKLAQFFSYVFFFQAEDGIRDFHVTGVQTCALPICRPRNPGRRDQHDKCGESQTCGHGSRSWAPEGGCRPLPEPPDELGESAEIGRAAGRERGRVAGAVGSVQMDAGLTAPWLSTDDA